MGDYFRKKSLLLDHVQASKLHNWLGDQVNRDKITPFNIKMLKPVLSVVVLACKNVFKVSIIAIIIFMVSPPSWKWISLVLLHSILIGIDSKVVWVKELN